jgi:hypothetical protein
MNKLILWSITLLALSGCAGSSAQESAAGTEHFNPAWAMDARWEQGTAEVAKYQAERIIYGKPRDFEYTLILVKETFNEEFNVKTDDYQRDDLYDVMKVNKFARIPTDNYPYHYMTSVFFRRDQPATLHKLVNTSQEWCGTTAKYFLNQGRNYTFGYNSYWDGQGVGETTVDGGILFEDQLSYSLRALEFADGLSFSAPVAESQVSSKASVPKIYEATFAVSQATDFSLDTNYDLGKAPVWRVRVQLDSDKTNTYWFSGEYPNVMLQQSTWDGQQLQLKEVYMDDYWVIG